METLFSGLSQEDVIRIKQQSVVQKYHKNDIIFSRNDIPEYLFILISGLVYVCDYSLDGHRSILTMIKEKDDCFGEVYLFMDIPYPYEAVAMSDCQILKIPKDLFLHDQILTSNMNRYLARKAFTLSKKLKLLMQDSLHDKIIEYLTQHPEVHLKRYELADYLGVSRPALSKEIYRMIDTCEVSLDSSGILHRTTSE